MKKDFIKMHGLGNDFVIFDARNQAFDLAAEKIAAIGDRHTGIGFDQMVIIDAPKSDGTDAFLRIYNADGGEVGACGNATRCVGALLVRESGKPAVTLETKSARLQAAMSGEAVTVDMGNVYLEWQEIPVTHEQNTESLDVEVGVLRHPVGVNVGNPHAVFFLHDKKIEDLPLEELGPRVENYPLFPEKVNVEIANVESPRRIRMRVWERGTGITRACGTGACAVAVAGVRRGLTQRKVTVALDGGTLDIEWRESDNHVLMTGPVSEVFRGEIEL
ncbi:MAG: diaminopimelate epimerase [Alphaproteobacteria bacterium]|nr:diaminopimelate epimerase [Alphaproteobacteria bacterium]